MGRRTISEGYGASNFRMSEEKARKKHGKKWKESSKTFSMPWSVVHEQRDAITLPRHHFRGYHLFFPLKPKARARTSVIPWLSES